MVHFLIHVSVMAKNIQEFLPELTMASEMWGIFHLESLVAFGTIPCAFRTRKLEYTGVVIGFGFEWSLGY